MEELKFSVITVSYNQGEYIRENIESVLAQNYKNFEHIVMDGGSTDNTLEVLKQYPHLRWFSERDRGQSHALNKAFALATGDIIAWINSDDFYPKNIFKQVAENLIDYPIYCGSSQIVNEKSEKLHDEPNFDRTYFDICKYWLAYSMPSQPSIFFRRELLEKVKYAPEVYLDEGLNYVMDIDLWLRMTAEYPLNRRTPEILAYYRMTETNKTSTKTDWFQFAESEMSRIFRRHQAKVASISRPHSFVIPVDTVESNELRRTLDHLANFDIDSEIVLVAYGTNPPLKATRKIASEFSAKQRSSQKNIFAYASAQTAATFSDALSLGAKVAAGEIISLLEPGVVPAASWANDLRAMLPFDRVGAALPIGHDAALIEHFGRDKFNPNGVALLSSPGLPGCIVIRKLAMLEMGELTPGNYPALAYREILMRTYVRGWIVHYSPQAKLEVAAGVNQQREQVFRNYVNALIMRSLDNQRIGDGFFAPRAATGFWYEFVDTLRGSAEKLLARAPVDWAINSFALNPKDITEKFPNFSPGWFLLANAAPQISGDAFKRYEELVNEEGAL